MWHLLIFRSSWEYLKNMTRILTTTFDKEVPLTVNTWHAVFASWNQKTTWIFEHSFTSHACDNGNTYCFGAWLQLPKHLKTPQWRCLVYLHIYSSGSTCAFSQIYWIYPVLEMGRKHNAWVAICHFSGLLQSLVHRDVSDHWLFFTLGHHINAGWFQRAERTQKKLDPFIGIQLYMCMYMCFVVVFVWSFF